MNVWKDMAIPLVVSLVTTVDRHGRPNASPKTWWTPVSYEPPLMQLCLKPTSDTALNIGETGVWMWHLPGPIIAKEVLHTAKPLPRGECELDDVGLPWQWLEHPKLNHPLPWVGDLPYVICYVMSAFEAGDHACFVGQVAIAGGFDREYGIDDIVLHRGMNRFVGPGPDFTVEAY